MIRRLCTSLPRVAGAFDAAQLQPASLLCHAVECTQQPANMRSFVAVAWRTRHWTSIPASGTQALIVCTTSAAHITQYLCHLPGTARPMATTSTADDSEQTNTPEQTSHSTQPADTPAPFYLKRRNHKRRMEARAEQRRVRDGCCVLCTHSSHICCECVCTQP